MTIEKLSSEEIPNEATERWTQSVKSYLANNRVGNSVYTNFYLTKSNSNNPTPENTGLIWVRNLLTDLEGRLSEENKYVLLQTYSNFGDMSTIDIVKLPKEYHKDIVREYFGILDENQLKHGEENFSRFLITGGSAKSIENEIEFNSNSADFGAYISRWNTNDVASYLVRQSGLFERAKSENPNEGEDYIKRIMGLMIENKGEQDFYSKLVDFCFEEVELYRNRKKIDNNKISAMIMMKSLDKAIKEGKPLEQMLVEEIACGGLGREFIIKGIADRIKEQKEKDSN